MTSNELSLNLLTNAKVMAMASQLIHQLIQCLQNSAYFDNIYGQFNELSGPCHGIFLIFLLPCSTKHFIMMRFNLNCASEITLNYQASSYCRVVTKNIASTGPRYFNSKVLNCCEYSVEMVLKRNFGE